MNTVTRFCTSLSAAKQAAVDALAFDVAQYLEAALFFAYNAELQEAASDTAGCILSLESAMHYLGKAEALLN